MKQETIENYRKENKKSLENNLLQFLKTLFH